MPKTTNDQELMDILLMQHKMCAQTLTQSILEAKNEALRRDYLDILQRTLEHQKQIFDAMSQRGWYNPQAANQQDIARARNEVSGMQM